MPWKSICRTAHLSVEHPKLPVSCDWKSICHCGKAFRPNPWELKKYAPCLIVGKDLICVNLTFSESKGISLLKAGCLKRIVMGMTDKYCHAERGCKQPNSASLVQMRFRIKFGMTVVTGPGWRWWQARNDAVQRTYQTAPWHKNWFPCFRIRVTRQVSVEMLDFFCFFHKFDSKKNRNDV